MTEASIVKFPSSSSSEAAAEDDLPITLPAEVPGEDDSPSRAEARMLSFYDTLRRRVVKFVAKRGGRLGPKVASALLVVPDVFMLLLRLSLDSKVPHSTRALIGGALAYYVAPIDLMPEIFVGPVGYLDDLFLAVAVLGRAFGEDLDSVARRHWSGSMDLHRVMQDISRSAESLLGGKLYDRLKGVLARQGIEVRDPKV